MKPIQNKSQKLSHHQKKRQKTSSHPLQKIPETLLMPLKKDSYLKKGTQFWIAIGIWLGLGGGTIVLGCFWHGITKDLPESIEGITSYVREDTLTIKGADGTVLQENGHLSHEKLKIEQIPPIIQQAFIASEDRRFYNHHGVDYQGITRAVLSNFQAKGVVQGGSTITQQLARMVFLSGERSIARKAKEAMIAQKIESQFAKKQILETYLNLVYLGSGAYGVADAAWVYFGKSVDQLNAAEAATLAAIVPAPSLYSPLANQQAAKERRDSVLQKMHKEGFLDADRTKGAIASPLVLQPKQLKRLQKQAPYFTQYIQEEIVKYVSPEVLKRGGIVVETTLNPVWQKKAEEAVNQTVTTYGKWQGFQQAAIVAIDPRNGNIKAMVGGNDFDRHQFNRVTQAKRQPGSTFKTFVYTTAIAAGFSPYKSYLDAEYVVDGYKPKNYGGKYRNKEVSIYDALRSSINIVALRTMLDVGWQPTIKTAQNMGIESELKSTYSLALGASEVNLLELTSAYGTLADKGVHRQAHGINRILDRDGKVIYQVKTESQRAIDEDTAAMMTWMLQSVVNSGTGTPAQIGRPVAGKTGTSDKARDLWFVGYIPQVVAGVWLGNDNNQPTSGASSTAAALWRKLMLNVVKEMPVENFPSRPRSSDRTHLIVTKPIKPRRSYYNYKSDPESDTASVVTTRSRSYRRKKYSYRNYVPAKTTSRRSSRLVPKNPVESPKPIEPNNIPTSPVLRKPIPLIIKKQKASVNSSSSQLLPLLKK